jgi:hypothetical protein
VFKDKSPLVSSSQTEGVEAGLTLINDRIDPNSSKIFGSEYSLSNMEASRLSDPILARKKELRNSNTPASDVSAR